MFDSPWTAALVALFAWWFSTGAILWVVKRSDRDGPSAHMMSVVLGLPFLAAGIWAYVHSLSMATVWGAYLGFGAAIVIWGWIELAFLAGVVTGPNTSYCPPGAGGWERFIRAWGTIAYHEMLLASALGAMAFLAFGAKNPFGFWVFAVLFCARISAKLNLFLGVPKINVEFLPLTMEHLPSHFRHARLNVLFPISVTLLSFAVACWLERIYAAQTAASEVGFALLAAITMLALLEHWLMVLPLPDEKLWRWMVPAPKTNDQNMLSEETHGL